MPEVPYGIGSRLSPENFPCLDSRSISYYALLEGWLLLSLPFDCLGVETKFVFDTGAAFWVLNRSLSCFSFAVQA